MPPVAHLLDEHNSACERARLSDCNCFCHGAGHQLDLLKRAVSCKPDDEPSSDKNTLQQLLLDLEGVYGGFHSSPRDADTPSRRTPPEDLAQIDLNRGRGASWLEKLVLDEALHEAFVGVANTSATMTVDERNLRKQFVVRLSEGALRIVGGDVEAHNIADGHLWCSVLAEALDDASSDEADDSVASKYGRIAYPRSGQRRLPLRLQSVREAGGSHVRSVLRDMASVPEAGRILLLMGAATCPDLWHHPAAVRFALVPFLPEPGRAVGGLSKVATRSRFEVLESRWAKRGHW